MRVALATRDSAGGRYLANRLQASDRLDALVVENGRTARRRKLARLRRQHHPIRLAMDLAAMLVYAKSCERHLRRRLLVPHGWQQLPPATRMPRVAVDDINEPAAASFLREQAVDLLIVHGTAILEPPLIKLPPLGVLNVHGGMVPAYRNVHCDFWAYVGGDHGHIGTAVLILDAGIDTGAIARQAPIDYLPGDGLRDCKVKNLELAGDLLEEVLSSIERNELDAVSQPAERAMRCTTPGLRDLLRLLFRSVPLGPKPE